MSKLGKMVVGIHQAVSFSAAMVRIPKAEAVFWPGCALMTLDPAILNRTLQVLRRAEPELQIAAAIPAPVCSRKSWTDGSSGC